jgi:hypothetical protein
MRKAIHPLFFIFLFANATIVLPVVVNGLRVFFLWYSPMAETGRSSFLYPFAGYVAFFVAINIVAAFVLKRAINWERYTPLAGRIGLWPILKGVWSDQVGRICLLAYVPLYFTSFLVSSGLLLVPNLNVSTYFVPLTQIMFQADGVPMFGLLAINYDILALGIINALVLSLALAFGYYINCLTFTSQKALDLGVPGAMKLAAMQGGGSILATSLPALATTSAICCLTPTGINSLLYLISTSSSILSKKVVWGYGTIAGAFWATGLLQGVELLSTFVIGIALLGLSFYQVRRIQRNVLERRTLKISHR